MRVIESSSVVAAGFGTLKNQVAGFHRAVPSTTLDKACMQFVIYFTRNLQKVNIFLIFLQESLHFLYGLFHKKLIR